MNRQRCVSAISLMILGLFDPAFAQQQDDFKDSASMSPEVATAVKQLTKAKILTVYPEGKFYPHRTLTRWEMAIASCRLAEHADLFAPQARPTDIGILVAVLAPAKPAPIPKEVRGDLHPACD